jgi:autotransporter-associated beta strand protein
VEAGAATTARFTSSLGDGNAIFDLGTNAGTLYERNNNPAVALGGLVGGPNTQLIGDCNGGNYPMTYTIGGANANTEFDGTITNGYSGSIAVTKIGTGTLILGGNNPYTGATIINSGELVGVAGGGSPNSAVSVAATGGNTATLGVSLSNNANQWLCASLTVNNGGGTSSLDFNFGRVAPSTTMAPMNVLGAATFTNVPLVTVELLEGGVTLGGQYPLMTWGTVSGTVPTNVTMRARGASGYLAVTGNTLFLVISSITNVEPLHWATSTAGVWDTSSLNWRDDQGDPTTYNATGDSVSFDDTYVTNDVAVTLNSVVKPTSVTVNNSVYDYTISGSGAIGGGGGLTKVGTGMLTLGLANAFSGGLTDNGGTLVLDFSAPNAPVANIIPAGDALTLGGGNLNLNGDAGETNEQTFNGTILTPGASAVTMTANGSAILGTVAGGNNPPTGGSVVFNGPATIGAGNVAVAASGAIRTTTAGVASELGGLGKNAGSGGSGNAWATVGLYDWASTFTTNGVQSSSPYTIIGGSQVPGFYTPTTGATVSGNNTMNVDFVWQEAPPGTVVSSIANNCAVRFNSPHAPCSTANPVQTGGFLITPNMGSVNAAITSWRALNNVQIVQNNTNAVFILGGVIESGTGAIVKSGLGTWYFDPVTGNNLPMNYVDANSVYQVNSGNYYTYAVNSAITLTSELFLNGGVTVINSNTVLGQATAQGTSAGSAGTINLNGGTLISDLNNVSLINPAAGNADRPVFLGGNGGGLAAQTNTTMSVKGVIANAATYAGPLSIGVAGNLVLGTGGTTANPALFANGTVDLSGGSNTYSGGTILQSGTIRINGINNLGGAATYGGMTLNGGTLQYAAAAAGAGSLDLSVGNSITLRTGGGMIDVNGNAVNYSNSIGNGGSGSLTVFSMAPNGVLSFSGANTYTGKTTITNVTFLVNNATGSATGLGALTVANGGILGGVGIIGGPVTVSTGGELKPGNPFGILNVSNNLNLTSGSTTLIQVQHSPLTNGAAQVSGTVMEGGALIVTNTGGAVLAAGDVFKLFGAGSYSSDFASLSLPQLQPGLAWATNDLSSAGLLSVISIVPKIDVVSCVGSNFVMSGSGGQPYGTYFVLVSTNLALPLSGWTRISTNVYDASGNFLFTNPLGSSMTAQFYLLQAP